MLQTKRITLVFLCQFVLTACFVVYCLLIVINFTEMFQSNLSHLQRKRENDEWLRKRCGEQEFVTHMRNHIDLCEAVEKNAMSNSYLVAVQMTLDRLHLCGTYSCEAIALYIIQSLRFSMYVWVVVIIVLFVLFPLCVLPVYRRWQRNMLLHESQYSCHAVPSVFIQDVEHEQHNNNYSRQPMLQYMSSEPSTAAQHGQFLRQRVQQPPQLMQYPLELT